MITWTKSILPDCNEYRSQSPSGVFVVKIFKLTVNPRVLVYHESTGRGVREYEPVSLFWSDLVELVEDTLNPPDTARQEPGHEHGCAQPDLADIAGRMDSLESLIMKTGASIVKSKEIEVGQAEYVIYETCAEALDGLGETKLLEILNAQIKTNAMNAVRTAATAGPSKKDLRDEAMASITREEFQEVAGDKVKFAALIDKKVAILEAERLAKFKAKANEAEENGN